MCTKEKSHQTHLSDALASLAQGRYGEAILAFQLALDGPSAADWQTRYQYATTLLKVRNYDEAIRQFDIVLAQNPENIPARNNRAVALIKTGRAGDAESDLRRILDQQSDYADALSNLALCLVKQGRTREAETHYRKVLAGTPHHPVAGPSLLLTMLYHDTDGEHIRQEHEKVTAQLTQGLTAARPAWRNPGGKIRVGFVSPDFCNHSVVYFALPLVAQLDRERFEVWCYGNVPRPDQVTERIRQSANHYRAVFGLSDEALARQIRADGIAILVDLAGHTENNRIRLFALCPAPCQATWLGYPSTTGLRAMDYRLTDAIADPAGAEAYYTEQLLRLPGGFLCYQGAADAPAPGELPMRSRGHVTFGSFNNMAKIQPETVRLWARVLHAIPDARLVLKAISFGSPQLRGHVIGLFAAEGIPSERLTLHGHTSGAMAHLSMYGEIDIALDTFPYNGTTTTCEALWMGVPVLTRIGTTHQGRVSASLLAQIGLGSCVASSDEQFVAKAVYLASDASRLSALRQNLRGAMAASPLCDSRRFAREFGDALLQMMSARPVGYETARSERSPIEEGMV